MVAESTILVKKSDGTQVRMTMAEFAEYRKQLSSPAQGGHSKADLSRTEKTPEVESVVVEEKQVEGIGNVELADKNNGDEEIKKPEERIEQVLVKKEKSEIINHKSEIIKDDLPAKEEEHELATTAPVKNIFVDEAISESKKQIPKEHQYTLITDNNIKQATSSLKWTDEDHLSPLEDRVEELKKHSNLGVLPDKKDDLFAEVLQKIKFPIPDDLRARLQSLITSRVKEIRDDAQFLIYVSRSTEAGGLGLKNEEANELLKIVKEVWHLANEKLMQKMSPVLEADKITIKQTEATMPKTNIFLPKEKTAGKPVLHDVTKPKPILKDSGSELVIEQRRAVGPIEEIKNFSLVDLRRLGNDTADNFKKLLQKFKVLEKDSIVLYFQALQAWYESPLYKDYQTLLLKALNGDFKIKDLALGDNTLTWDEVGGVINLQTKLI